MALSDQKPKIKINKTNPGRHTKSPVTITKTKITGDSYKITSQYYKIKSHALEGTPEK